MCADTLKASLQRAHDTITQTERRIDKLNGVNQMRTKLLAREYDDLVSEVERYRKVIETSEGKERLLAEDKYLKNVVARRIKGIQLAVSQCQRIRPAFLRPPSAKKKKNARRN